MFSMLERRTSTNAYLTPPQEQTGKGSHLRDARAPDGRPEKAPAVRGMQTGEVEAKVLVVGLKDDLPPACCVARYREAPARRRRGLPFMDDQSRPRRKIRTLSNHAIGAWQGLLRRSIQSIVEGPPAPISSA
jgi:hypothetical protein